MVYLIDANILINAERDYYPLDQVPEFWEWVKYQGEAGFIKLPVEIWDEVMKGGKDPKQDPLLDWLKSEGVEKALKLEAEVETAILQQVVEKYAPDLTDSELEEIGNDPFLIAYACADSANITVVTAEISRPSAQRQNRRVPDVCNDLNVKWCTVFTMNKALGFKTSWKS